MKDNEKIRLERYDINIYEDIHGMGKGKIVNGWGMNTARICDGKEYNSVWEMVKDACEFYGFTFNKDNWTMSEDGWLEASFEVDSENNEVENGSELWNKWENEETDLYVLDFFLKPEVVVSRDITEEDL